MDEQTSPQSNIFPHLAILSSSGTITRLNTAHVKILFAIIITKVTRWKILVCFKLGLFDPHGERMCACILSVVNTLPAL